MFLSGKQAQKTWETLRDIYRTELKKRHDTKSDQAAGITHESKWQYFTISSFVNVVMIPRPTLSNVPAVEESARVSIQNLEDDKASTNLSTTENENYAFKE
jgi:hypothetical protein